MSCPPKPSVRVDTTYSVRSLAAINGQPSLAGEFAIGAGLTARDHGEYGRACAAAASPNRAT